MIGVLLLINPVGFTTGIIVVVGVFLALGGVRSIIQYFRINPKEALISQNLFKGLIMLLAGIFCMFKAKWFIVTFPILTILYGIAILITGLAKVQWTIDMIRLKQKKWGLAALSAVLSIICGFVILHSPFTSTAVLWMFAGIYLIIEALFDIIALFFIDKDMESGNQF